MIETHKKIALLHRKMAENKDMKTILHYILLCTNYLYDYITHFVSLIVHVYAIDEG